MSNVYNDTRPSFFPNSKSARAKQASKKQLHHSENNYTNNRSPEIKYGNSTSVDIPPSVRDFSRIKDMAVNAPERDNSDKIAMLRDQINSGSYEIDYEKLADKLLVQEFN